MPRKPLDMGKHPLVKSRRRKYACNTIDLFPPIFGSPEGAGAPCQEDRGINAAK